MNSFPYSNPGDFDNVLKRTLQAHTTVVCVRVCKAEAEKEKERIVLDGHTETKLYTTDRSSSSLDYRGVHKDRAIFQVVYFNQ